MPGELLFAQLALQIGERNLHRTHDAALVAERRGLRQIERVFEPHVHRRKDRADGTRIHPAIRVTADILIDWAMIHACAAANTAERLADLARKDRRASAVNENEIHV